MSYVELAPVALLCALILFLPGLALALSLRLRGLWAVATAPALGLTVLATASILAPVVGMTWGPMPILIVTLAAVLGVGILTWLVPATRQRRVAARPAWWPVGVGALLAAAIIGFQLVRVTGSPEAFSQSYDNVFHLNAVRWVLDTQSASPFSLGRMTSPEGALGFYPSAWHGLTALVVQITGTSIPVAINAVSFVGACVIWPIGVMLLTRTIFGRNGALTVAAGVLAAAFPTYPLLLLNYGVLYPMFLSYAVLPLAVAALIRLVGAFPASDGLTRWPALLVLGGVVPGMAVAHPGALVSLLAFSLPIVVVASVRVFAAKPGRRESAILAGWLVAYAVFGVVALQIVRPPADQIYWPIAESPGQAIGEVLTASVYFMPVAFVAAALMIVGIVCAIRQRDAAGWTAIGLWALAGVLYVIVAASPWELVRLLVTGPWYNNIPRLAALYPLATIPLAAFGASQIWRVVSKRMVDRRSVSRSAAGSPRLLAVGLAAALTGLLVASTQGAAIRDAVNEARGVYAIGDDSWMLTPDELAMFERVQRIVPEDEVIGGSPWTGAGLAYAFAGRHVLMPHLLMDVSPDLETFLDGFATAEPGEPACAATRRLDVEWILDFGDQQINNSENTYPGLEDLEDSANVELVDEVGEARLYRIVGCGVG